MTKRDPTRKTPADVINFSSQKDARENVGEIIHTCRRITTDALKDLLRDMFERADDTLFDFAERSESNTSQTRYFDSMRELRRQRNAAEGAFRSEVARGFKEFARQENRHAQKQAAARDLTENDLELVDEDQYEETLAITTMVSKAQTQYLGALHALDKRFSVLRGGIELDSEDNPAGPARLCEAFRVATEPFDLDVQAKIVVYKLFERFVILRLHNLYAALNKALVEAGVLPEIRSTIKRPPHAGGSAGPGEAQQPYAPPDSGDETAVPGQGAGSEQERILSSIEQLLATRHSGAQAGSYAPPGPGRTSSAGAAGGVNAPSVPTVSLLEALGSLQFEAARGEHEGEDRVLDPSRFKQLLNTKVVHTAEGDDEVQVSTQDEDTIDLVGMLFEFIVQDRNLPDPIQATLTRLQIPYLKVALTNKHFLVQRGHPARKLLDNMARAGIGWTRENEKSSHLLQKIEAIVERVLNEFDEDLDLFTELVGEFDSFMARQERIAGIAEKRTAEATQGRERLHMARKDASREILSRLDERGLPPVVRRFLAKPWTNALILTALRHGRDSEEWEHTLKVADDVIWAVKPKRDDAERAALRELVLPLMEAVQEGLSLVAIHEQEVTAFQDELANAFERALNGATGPKAETQHEPEADEPEELPAWMEEMDRESEAEGEPGLEVGEETEAELEAAGLSLDIPIGTWFEIYRDDKPTQRAKLSWISPISQRYLFVNQKGLKVEDKAPGELAARLLEGRIRVLDNEPLLERALGSIKEQLGRQKEGAKESPEA